MNYDFKNKAIKCDTWEKMEHLGLLAKESGLHVATLLEKYFNEHGFKTFASSEYFDTYMNLFSSPKGSIEISYSDFISQSNLNQSK